MPTKLVTPGVLRTTYHESSSIFIFDEHVAGIDLLIDRAALAVMDLDLFLSRDDDLEDLLAHVHRLDARFEVLLDLRLVARVRMDDVPLRPHPNVTPRRAANRSRKLYEPSCDLPPGLADLLQQCVEGGQERVRQTQQEANRRRDTNRRRSSDCASSANPATRLCATR